MTGVMMELASAPYTFDVLSPGTTSITIPSDTVSVSIVLQAAGGSSDGRAVIDGSAGGGGAYAVVSRAILSGEWGTSLTVAIGAGSAGNDGGNTTLSGTLNGASVSVTCNGGKKGTSIADGIGGTATGGDTNISGEDGSGYVVGPPGDEQPGTPGRGGCWDQPTGFGYDFFGAGCGGIASNVDEPGFDGFIAIQWSY